jgi:hypothetical protein
MFSSRRQQLCDDREHALNFTTNGSIVVNYQDVLLNNPDPALAT